MANNVFSAPSFSGPGDAKPSSHTNSLFVLRRIGEYFKEYKLRIAFVLFFTLLSNVLSLLTPVFIGNAVNTMRFDGDIRWMSPLFLNVLWIFLTIVSSAVLAWACQRLLIVAAQSVTNQLRNAIFTKVEVLPVSYFDKTPKGEVLSRLSYDVDTLNTSLSSDVIQGLTGILTVAGSFAMMLYISPLLVLIFVGVIPLTIYLTGKITRSTRRLFQARSKEIADLNGYTEEMLSGKKTVLAFDHGDETIEEFQELNEVLTKTSSKAQYLSSILMPSLNFINNLSFLLIAIFGILLTLQGKMNIGGISSFILYSKKFTGPINETAGILGDIQSALACGERIFTFLDEEEEPADEPGDIEIHDPEGSLSFHHVSFEYTKDVPVLKDISLEIQQNKVIAIVGPTGVGKTTFVNLLLRFYDVTKGSIEMDGIPIRSITRKSLRKSFGMVLQDPFLFSGSIRKNITYGNRDVTEAEMIAAAKAAHIHSFIDRLPDGYDTLLHEEGIRLSEGQKQLLVIARTMLADPAILILDEATSSIDTRTEIQIQKAMTHLMKGRTCFVIAHRLSTIRDADRILVMKDGQILESGSHKELLLKDGFYKKLYNSQKTM